MAVKKKQPSRSRHPQRPPKRPRKPPPPPVKKKARGAAVASPPHERKSPQSQKKPDSKRNKKVAEVTRNRVKSAQQAKRKPPKHLPEQTAGTKPAGRSPKEVRKGIRKHLVVTTKEERAFVEHIELRNEAIQKEALSFPDQRLRKVKTSLPSAGMHAGGPWSRIPRKGISKNTFIREELTHQNLTEILFRARNAINHLARKKPTWDIFSSMHMTEYGLNLYGSDKEEISSKAFRTEALHRTVLGFPMTGSVEAMLFVIEARLEDRIKEREDSGTTAIIEYINVSLFEPDPEKTLGREDMTPGGQT